MRQDRRYINQYTSSFITMNKCFKGLTVFLVTLISATAIEDICESCVLLSKCSLFTSMSETEQQSWMQKYPCNNHHPDDYGTPPGSRATQEDFICCPNQIWGMDPSESSSSRLTDENRFEYPQSASGAISDQSQNPYYLNYNRQNKENGDNNDDYILLTNNRRNSDNQNTHTLEPTRWSSTSKNKYWNERPDKSQWDIGNQNYYHGNNNDRRGPGSNWRNYFDNDQGARTNQPDTNNQGSGRNQNDSRYSRNPGNSFNKPGQCDRLTRFPPDPQTGCCGREATDDDRITGTPFKINSKNQLETKLTKTIDDAPNYNNNFAHASNQNWPPQEELPSSYEWSYFKEEVNRTRSDLITKGTITFNSTVQNGTDDDNSTVYVENRISGGKETELTQYPWTALLITTFDNGMQRTAFNCGGSLISSRFVLTAGHCVYDDVAEIKSVQVFVAEFDKRTFPRDCKMTGEGRKCIDNIAMYAKDVILHPRFNETRLHNDIALIKLQMDVPYTDYIRPICLPAINIDDPEHARLTLTVSGWGRNGQYKSDVKQSTTVHLVPQYDCRKFYPDLTPRHLCAAGYTGEDTCKGDSGGPLMVLYRGTYYVVGVVSGKRTDAPCGSAVPSLYTNVYHYLDWIKSNLNS